MPVMVTSEAKESVYIRGRKCARSWASWAGVNIVDDGDDGAAERSFAGVMDGRAEQKRRGEVCRGGKLRLGG